MSSIAIGQVVAVPGAAAGAAAAGLVAVAAVGLAAVGVGVCVVGGTRAVIAGSQAVKQVCREHAAQRQAMAAVNARVNRIRKSQKALEAEAWQGFLREAAKHHADQALHWKTQLTAMAARPATEGQTAPEFVKPLSSIQMEETRIVDILHRIDRREALNAQRLEANRTLEGFETGEWRGLFEPNTLKVHRKGLKDVTDYMDNDQLGLADVTLTGIRRDLIRMQQDASQVWVERFNAVTALHEAGDHVAQALQQLSEDHDLYAEAQAMQETYQMARQALDKLNFKSAKAQARSAGFQAQTLMRAKDQPRREHLTETLRLLEDELKPYRDSEQAKPTLAQLTSIKERLANNELDRAESLLEEASQNANALLKQVAETDMPQIVRDRLAQIAAEQLKDMGFTVSEEQNDVQYELDIKPNNPFLPLSDPQFAATEKRVLVGTNGEREFQITITAEGAVWCDLTQGYKGNECNEIKDFIAGLERRGVVGLWETQYTFEQAAECLRDVLYASGYEVFYEGPTDDGNGWRVEAQRGSDVRTSIINWNGQLSGDPLTPASDTYLNETEIEIETIQERQKLLVRN